MTQKLIFVFYRQKHIKTAEASNVNENGANNVNSAGSVKAKPISYDEYSSSSSKEFNNHKDNASHNVDILDVRKELKGDSDSFKAEEVALDVGKLQAEIPS